MSNKIKVILLDFSYTLCFPKTKENVNSLSGLYSESLEKDSSSTALDNFILNQELLDYLQTLKTTHKIYIFTSGLIHTDPTIQTILKPIFDGYITSIELKLPKTFPNAYKIIANKLGVNTDNILFIDDQQKNVVAAKTAGALAIRYTNNIDVISQIKKAL